MKKKQQKATYVNRWGYEIALIPALPGVWRKKEGGYLVRGRATDPRTKKQREVMRALDGDDPAVAYSHLQELLRAVRNPTVMTPIPSKVLFADYAVSLLARKIDRGEIKSAKTRRLWGDVLTQHLVPAFGTFAVTEVRRADIQKWLDGQAASLRRPEEARVLVANTPKKRSRVAKVAPRTVNIRLAILRVIVNAFVEEHDLDRNPMRGVHPLDASDHPTYTDEEPNSLTVEEARRFLSKMRELCPQHFAMTALGFATGLRPSTLRPLRRKGSKADVLWDDGVLLVRRSQTVGDEVMNTTKTRQHQRIAIPEDLVAILRWHVDTLPDDEEIEKSELLFPSDIGGFRAPSALDKPFALVRKALGLRKRITPRAMRRTFQDLARAAAVGDLVTRSISGHATEEMQRHYSTVGETEQRAGIARVVSLAGFREALRSDASKGEVVGKVVGNSP